MPPFFLIRPIRIPQHPMFILGNKIRMWVITWCNTNLYQHFKLSNQGLNLFHLHLLNRCGASDVSQFFTPQSLFGWSRIVKNASFAGFWRDFVEPLVPEVFFEIKDIRNRESSYTYSTVWRNHFKIAKYKFIRIGPQLQQRPVFFLVARVILNSFKIRPSTKDILGNLLKIARNLLSNCQEGWVSFL